MTVIPENKANPFTITKSEGQTNVMMEVAASRQAQEVQAAMVIAKKFPRDEFEAFNKIMNACKRPTLAKEAIYSYPRGGTTVKGPSIRLAEVLAQQWGNIDFGIIELEQRFQESTVMAYAWDLETNTRQTKVFSVPHKRHTKTGAYNLTDPRDIYEMVANNGARRLRACILGVIPGDIIDKAVEACNETLVSDNSEGPLEDRIRKMVLRFSDIGVNTDMLEMRLGHKLEVTTVQEMVNLGSIYKSISDNMAPIEQYFDRPDVEGQPQTLKEKMASKITKPKPAENNNVEFTKALAKLSLMYEDRSKEIDDILNMNGIDGALIDIKPDCPDEKIIKEVIKIAKEF